MDIKTDICTWLLKQQEWFQVLAENLIAKGGLSVEDINCIVALIKTPEGQSVTKNRTFDGLASPEANDDTLRLIKIDTVRGIENLAPRIPLDFGTGNLTVIYGHNGSGKSSYTRVLKRVSGKPRAAPLKPNVFQPTPPEQSCHITWEINGVSESESWTSNSAAINALKVIDIFDTDEAQHYLTQESTATYIPSVVSFFEKLAQYTKIIREKLSSEQGLLVSQLPMLPDSYRRCIISGNYSALGGVSAENISIMTNWSDVDEQMLKVLNERLSVQDPTEHARQKLALRTSVIQIITKLEQTARAFSVSGIDTIRALRADARTKRIAAQESQKIKDGSLEGVGTSTWRAMWEAARIYSQLPYPDVAFPVTAGASCLLCNQELSAEAQQRLVNFEAFVQSRIEIEANAAEDYYVRALSNLMVFPSTPEIATLCAGAALPDQWEEYLSSIWTLASASRQSLIEHEAIQNAQPIPDLSDAITKLIVYRDKLQGEADQFQKDAAGFDKAKAILDKNEAEARKWVASQKESIEAELVRLRRYGDYDKWIGFTNSRFISLKSTDVTQKVVTDAYAARFNQELRALGAGTIQVELVKIRTENAKVLHQLQLIGVQRDKPHNVLSEGERRIISLAAFLADVSDRPGSAPFIFDDPISSLDHDFEWHVAKRLVELAKSRQVIILTHRLSLFGVIEDLAKKEGDAWKKQHHLSICIESYNGVAGQPADQAAWNANTRSANNILLEKLNKAFQIGEEHGAEAYRGLAQGICSDFRKLIERSVEEDLLNGVVLRHRRGIQTDGRLQHIPSISLDDCKLIESLMTKYSCFEHSQSTEMPIFIPEFSELQADLTCLKEWREQLKKRRTQ